MDGNSSDNFDVNLVPDNPYLLLTPGPLSTSKGVRAVMFRDWCTWDDDYNSIVQEIRKELVEIATNRGEYTCVLMQGSGTFSVESAIGTMMPKEGGKLLVLVNGAYGARIVEIAKYLNIPCIVHNSGELDPPDLERLEDTLKNDTNITHVAVVHCETTTGILNPIEDIGRIVKGYEKKFFVDAMSSFGGIPFDVGTLSIDFLVSSANKCIQGVPGFGFIIAKVEEFQKCAGNARSLSLDAYAQWEEMERNRGKWRFTSPTHTVRAFKQALKELRDEGGVNARYNRYKENHKILVEGMESLGFKTVIKKEWQSPIITSFYSPNAEKYDFKKFYALLKSKGFVIYPGKLTAIDAFRIGNIGHIFPEDIKRLLKAIEESIFW
ncbi:MAG: 2-aminoethylphosphonate--pyruvate transaminase [Candidatus Hydrogenedentes bacterium]|nr:2-aminoethylphosphonate--pyruvate transaminase [Candidatus Hydrogenedentota bacterium]